MATGETARLSVGSRPRAAAYLITATLALAFSYDLMRKPIQIPDSLIDILHMQESPSVYATFQDAVAQRAYLRPLRIVQVKALFDVADGHYWLVFRGFHALLLVCLLLLFTRALRIQSWTDFAAGIFAIMVLTGMHTFRGTVREAFPINHFAEILLFCLLTLNLAQSRGGWWVDVAAAVTFVAASLTLESGLLVWVVAVVAWLCGMRGISRRGVTAMTLLLAVYFVVRFAYLSTGAPGLDERPAGVWLTMMTQAELIRRFGADPTLFYIYNVAASVLSVLFAEPERGVFLTARAWIVDGETPARLYLATDTDHRDHRSDCLGCCGPPARPRTEHAEAQRSVPRAVRGGASCELRAVVRVHQARDRERRRSLLRAGGICSRAPRHRARARTSESDGARDPVPGARDALLGLGISQRWCAPRDPGSGVQGTAPMGQARYQPAGRARLPIGRARSCVGCEPPAGRSHPSHSQSALAAGLARYLVGRVNA